MMNRSFVLAFGFAVLAGCGGQSSTTETPTGHPAHPSAAETPTAERSRTLQDERTARSAAAGGGQRDAAGVVYTCPHHPEVTSNQPGVCPKCDMKLQPKTAGGGATAEGGHSGHGGHQ